MSLKLVPAAGSRLEVKYYKIKLGAGKIPLLQLQIFGTCSQRHTMLTFTEVYILHLQWLLLLPYPSILPPLPWGHIVMSWVAVQSTGYASVQLSRQDNTANLSCRVLGNLLSLRVLRLIFSRQLIMFPVRLGWTGVGGLTDNRQWEDMGERHSRLSAWWPSVGGMHAGSDKGQTANCFLQFLLNANQ